MSKKKELWQQVQKWGKFVGIGLLITILLLFVYFFLNSMFPCIGVGKSNAPHYVMAFCAVSSLIAVLHEYDEHKKRERAATFSEYNKRYSEDENIKAVTRYLICFLEHHEIGDNHTEMPSVYQKEMFLRFFEELEFQMQQGRLTENEVTKFFAYYAVAAAMDKEFLKDTELGKKNYKVWENYRNFVKRFEDMEESIANDYARSFADKNGIERLQLQIF